LDSTNVAVDITGYTVYAEVRRTVSGDLVLDLEPEITDAAAGEITIELTAAETDDLVPGNYGWDLVLMDTDDKRTGPYVQGGFNVAKSFTHLS
jgi:hypothetical protein